MEVYMDNAATTKPHMQGDIDSSVLAMYGNPSSAHALGKQAREQVESAREKLAQYIGCEVEEIIFTSGGTEANNLALFGLARGNPTKKHIIVSAIEHDSILEVCSVLHKDGYKIDYIGVNSEGIVDPQDVLRRITPETLVVSIMHANNEIGTVQPIQEIAEICTKKEVYFHTDAVQSFTKIPTNVRDLGIDMMTVSGHKVHAPKGIGFLYVKLGTRIKPLIYGGGHEFKLRAGTENSFGITSLGSALDIDIEKEKVQEIRDYMITELQKIDGVRINGSLHHRLHHNIHVSFKGIDSSALVAMLSEAGVYVSTGSACSTKKLEESHVLRALGVPEDYIHGSIRITLSHENTLAQAQYALESIKKNVRRLREMSPFN